MVQGGVEKHCESLYPLFDSRYRFCVFRRKPYVRSSQTYPDIAFIDLPSTRIKGFEAFFHSFLATVYCLFLRPDVVHIHNIGPALFSPLLRLFGLKTVLTYHSPNYEHKKWGFFARHLLKLSERIAFRTADKVIFVNRFQMEKSLKQLGGKACYIPNGIPSVKPASESSYISQLGLEPGKYVLSVGRITPEKGFDCLLKAYARIPRPGYKLVIAGGVSANRLLRARLQEECGKRGWKFYRPELCYCGDNAAMVASQGYCEFLQGNLAGMELNACANMAVDTLK